MAVIKWKKNATLVVITGYDEKLDRATEEDESFVKDEQTEVDIIASDFPDYVAIQFGDGSVAYGVPTNLYEVIEED